MKNLFFFSFIICCISSCKKDVAIPVVKNNVIVTPHTAFVPLTVGSFWVYNYYYVDTLGNETYWNSDTVRIIKDSIINGKTYAMFDGLYFVYNPNHNYLFRRDSSGCLLDQGGDILFTYTDFIDTLRKYTDTTGAFWFSKMAHKDSSIAVPAGTFVTSEYETIVFNPPTYPFGKIRHVGTYYSNGVGVVKNRTYYSGSPNYIDSKLVSYYIAP